MLGKKQSLFNPPMKYETSKQNAEFVAPGDYGIYADQASTPRPISLAMVCLHVKGDPREEMAYESYVHAEANVAAVLVRLLEKACGEGDGIFVACPHRIQRAAVNLALSQWDKEQRNRDSDEDEELQQLIFKMGIGVEECDGNKLQKVS